MAIIRLASEADAAAVSAIYAPYVRDTAISFEVEPPGEEELRRRIAAVLAYAPWLVCEAGGSVLGYAYAGRFHARAAYQWTVEVTVYVARDRRRMGVGRGLYVALLDCLRLHGFRTAVGVIALPNAASVGLHEQLGFRRVGVLPGIGFKHGGWHDIGYWQLELGEAGEQPGAPLPPAAVVGTPAWEEACARAAAGVGGSRARSRCR